MLTAGWKLDIERQHQLPTVSVDDVLQMQSLLPLVDFSQVRAVYLELVHRLRHAGISISDRRAVKLQRLQAASALLCGRFVVSPTDLWIPRDIWDTEEQQEVIATIVQDAVNRHLADDVVRHPCGAGQRRSQPRRIGAGFRTTRLAYQRRRRQPDDPRLIRATSSACSVAGFPGLPIPSSDRFWKRSSNGSGSASAGRNDADLCTATSHRPRRTWDRCGRTVAWKFAKRATESGCGRPIRPIPYDRSCEACPGAVVLGEYRRPALPCRLSCAAWAPSDWPVDQALELAECAAADGALPARLSDRIPMRLVADGSYREPNLLLTSLSLWTSYGVTAPQVRLDRWHFAVSAKEEVIVRGVPLPPLPGNPTRGGAGSRRAQRMALVPGRRRRDSAPDVQAFDKRPTVVDCPRTARADRVGPLCPGHSVSDSPVGTGRTNGQ